MFGGDFQSIRRFAERDHSNIVSWHSYGPAGPAGSPADAPGHYAAHEATDVLVADIQQFFALLAGGTTPRSAFPGDYPRSPRPRSPLRAEADAD
jgi:hypothetical protein